MVSHGPRRTPAPNRRRMPSRSRWPGRLWPSVAVVAVLLMALGAAALLRPEPEPTATPTAPRPDPMTDGVSESASKADAAPESPSAPAAPWGPTGEELTRARAQVAQWTPERLAGQVIVGRYVGTDPEEPAELVRELHLAGICITSGNVLDTDQILATTAAISAAMAEDGREFPAVVGVDQEGGLVSHLRGVATEFPPFADAGAAIGADQRAGAATVTAAARTTALELRGLGFTWVFAPVADVTIGAADPTIGSRSPSADAELAARATAAAVQGYDDAAMVSTTKHFPGHGSATADSHEVLPVVDSSLDDLQTKDLAPFRAAVAARAPAIMISHLDVQALAPGKPASLAAPIYDFLREELEFEGVAITDSLGMGAVTGRDQPAVTALNAGADLLLMPPDPAHTHAVVTAAIESGDISRERAEEAAGRVVALQWWQQRVADEVPVPDDIATRAAKAAAELAAAG